MTPRRCLGSIREAFAQLPGKFFCCKPSGQCSSFQWHSENIWESIRKWWGNICEAFTLATEKSCCCLKPWRLNVLHLSGMDVTTPYGSLHFRIMHRAGCVDGATRTLRRWHVDELRILPFYGLSFFSLNTTLKGIACGHAAFNNGIRSWLHMWKLQVTWKCFFRPFWKYFIWMCRFLTNGACCDCTGFDVDP